MNLVMEDRENNLWVVGVGATLLLSADVVQDTTGVANLVDSIAGIGTVTLDQRAIPALKVSPEGILQLDINRGNHLVVDGERVLVGLETAFRCTTCKGACWRPGAPYRAGIFSRIVPAKSGWARGRRRVLG